MCGGCCCWAEKVGGEQDRHDGGDLPSTAALLGEWPSANWAASDDANRATVDNNRTMNVAYTSQSQFIMCGRVRSNGCELQRDIRYGTTARLTASVPAVLTLAAANCSNAGAIMNDFVGVRKSLTRRVFDSAEPLHSSDSFHHRHRTTWAYTRL